MAVGREFWVVAKRTRCGWHDLERLVISFQRQCPNVLSSRYSARIDDVLSVVRPVTGKQQLIVAQQFLFGAPSVRGFAKKLELAIAVGRVSDPFAVRRPERGVVENRPKRKARADAPRQIVHPNVAYAIVHLKGDAVALRRKPKSVHICQPLGDCGLFLRPAIHPVQFQGAVVPGPGAIEKQADGQAR